MGVFGHGLWCCPSSVGCLCCSWLGFGFGLLLGRVLFRGRPACPPPFPVPARGVGVCAGPGSPLCPALLGWVVGVCFFFCALAFSFLFFFFRALWSLSLHPLSFGLGWWLSFCFFIFIFFFRVPFPRGPLLLAWCCRFWVGGPPVPLWGSLFFFFFRCLLGGGLAACGGVGGRFGGCGLFSCLFCLPPSFFFFGGGGLPVPPSAFLWAGARTGLHSVLSSGLLSSVAFCVATFRPHGSGGLCTRWARRPFLLGWVLALPAGRLRQAAACGFGLGGWGFSCPYPSAVPAVIFWVVRHRSRLARCGPVCGLRCWCVAWWRGAFPGVRWLASVSPSG